MGRLDVPAEIAILHYPGAQLSAIHGLTDVFGIANDRSREIGGPAAPVLRVTHWGPASPAGPVEKTFDTHGQFPSRPAVAIAGPSIRDLPTDPAMLDTLAGWLRERHSAGSVVGSVCSGAYLLAYAGLLDGRTATTHWRHAADYAARFPAVRFEAESVLVDDGDIITAGGVTSGLDLALWLVERFAGAAIALQLERQMEYERRGTVWRSGNA
jgi:transcriptional regulator GlxA family with amidase domain